MWIAVCQDAFEKLRSRLSSAPVLAYPDFCMPFILETDPLAATIRQNM